MTEKMTLTEKTEQAQQILSDRGEVLNYAERTRLTWEAFIQPARMRKFKGSPVEFRQEAQRRSHAFYEFCENLGIPVNVQGVDTIENASNIPLWLGNHQKFGFEAVNICDLTPDNTRTMLKDSLLKIPLFGPALAGFDPIVFDRSKTKEDALEATGLAQAETIRNGGSVMIFPEGGRKGPELGLFKSRLFQHAYEAALKQDNTRQRVAVISTDASTALPFKMGPKVLVPTLTTGFKTPVNVKIDILDLDPDETAVIFKNRVRNLISGNLNTFANQRLEELAA